MSFFVALRKIVGSAYSATPASIRIVAGASSYPGSVMLPLAIDPASQRPPLPFRDPIQG